MTTKLDRLMLHAKQNQQGYAFNPRMHRDIEVEKLDKHMPLQSKTIIEHVKQRVNAPVRNPNINDRPK